MSPFNKKKLNSLRLKLDKLDSELLKLIKKRSNIVNEVLKIKIHKKEAGKALTVTKQPRDWNERYQNAP